jgi:hypothetical protein
VDCREILKNGEIVDGWLRPGYWHILTYHGIGDHRDGWAPVSEAEFDQQMAQLATFRDSGIAEVVTFNKGANRLRRLQIAGSLRSGSGIRFTSFKQK